MRVCIYLSVQCDVNQMCAGYITFHFHHCNPYLSFCLCPPPPTPSFSLSPPFPSPLVARIRAAGVGRGAAAALTAEEVANWSNLLDALPPARRAYAFL